MTPFLIINHVLFSPLILGQTVLQATSGINWLYVFTQSLENLLSQDGDALTQVGLTELSFVSFIVLIRMTVRWNTASMSFRYHHEPVRMGDLTNFLMLLIFCLLLENYWSNPLPGVSFGINGLFSYFAQIIVSALDRKSLTSLLSLIAGAAAHTARPPSYMLTEVLCYLAVQLFLGLADAILFFINCSSYIFYGVSALFGPVFIPLLMTRTFRNKFFQFVDVLLSLAMMRAVAAAFIFVWAGFLNKFIEQTFGSGDSANYSIDMWLANLLPCLTVFVAFIVNMACIPKITQMLFGGGAGAVEGLGGTIAAGGRAVASAAVKVAAMV